MLLMLPRLQADHAQCACRHATPMRHARYDAAVYYYVDVYAAIAATRLLRRLFDAGCHYAASHTLP